MFIAVKNLRNAGRDGLVVTPFMGGVGFRYECAFPALDLASASAEFDQIFPLFECDSVAQSGLFLWDDSALGVEWFSFGPDTVEAWDRAWAVFRIFSEWKLESREAREQSCRICQTILVFLLRPVFPFHIISKERAWSLLHGAHPPRHNAGIPTPAFAVS
jgi:hypothetical protein